MADDQELTILQCLEKKSFAPLLFQQIPSKLFLNFLKTTKTMEIPALSFVSSLEFLFQEFGQPMSKIWKQEMEKYFQNGQGRQMKMKIPTNKEQQPLTFAMYSSLCEMLTTMKENSSVYIKLVLILQWNLKPRKMNVSDNITLEKMTWCEDALRIYRTGLPKKGSKKNIDARHLYANPLNPTLCPILTLGMYFMIYGFETQCLFANNILPVETRAKASKKEIKIKVETSNPYQEFLQYLLQNEQLQYPMRSNGISYKHLGDLSFTAGPVDYIASQIQAGTLSTKYWCSGDQHTLQDTMMGRILAGLPVETANFSVLPPHFTLRDGVDELIDISFPGHPAPLKPVLEYCLASLIYHSTWMKETLPKTHIIFKAFLFQQKNVLRKMGKNVKSGLPIHVADLEEDDDFLLATGVPQHMKTLTEFQLLSNELQELEKEDPVNFHQTISNVVFEMKNRSTKPGKETTRGLIKTLAQYLSEDEEEEDADSLSVEEKELACHRPVVEGKKTDSNMHEESKEDEADSNGSMSEEAPVLHLVEEEQQLNQNIMAEAAEHCRNQNTTMMEKEQEIEIDEPALNVQDTVNENTNMGHEHAFHCNMMEMDEMTPIFMKNITGPMPILPPLQSVVAKPRSSTDSKQPTLSKLLPLPIMKNAMILSSQTNNPE